MLIVLQSAHSRHEVAYDFRYAFWILAFVSAAKELRKRGVEHITLVVSHCENNILKGEVFDYIDEVFTTDSICTVSHPKLIVTKKYREGILNVQN